jgi:1-acyl-sn-glycerol-3-phosphate acyltransferase
MLQARQRYKKWASGYAYWPARGLCRIITSVLFDIKAYGIENVPEHGGALIVSNHCSFLDPVLVGVQILRPMNFMAKSELWTNPIFGRLISSVNAFPIRQGEGDIGAVRETIRLLQNGALLNIFPEGSRSDDGELAPIQTGISLIVRKANVPVIPCLIEGSWQAWPNTRKLPSPYPIDVQYGPAMSMAGLKTPQIVKTIGDTLARMQHEVRQRRQRQHRGAGPGL